MDGSIGFNQSSFVSQSQQSNETLNDEDDLWNDPNLLNDPKKLMKIKFTQEDLRAATSPEFVANLDFITELVMQESRIKDMLHKHSQLKVPDEDSAVEIMENTARHLDSETEKCIKIYTACKSLPFWGDRNKMELLSDQQKKVVQRWIDVVDKFNKAYEQAHILRTSRKSLLQSDDVDPEVMKLVGQLTQIFKQLSVVYKIMGNY